MATAQKIVCRNVWKLYGANTRRLFRQNLAPSSEEMRAAGVIPAVRGVNLEVQTGEIYVIMGLSGSGKSTLVRCMSRLIEPDSGEIFLDDGKDLLKSSRSELIDIRRHKMGMVFQHFALLPHLTVRENVAFPLKIQGRPTAEVDELTRAVIGLVGLEGREDNFPRELSGGQQQRVGIARSLAVDPELWFLDEPFSALDPLIRREMQDEFLRVQGLLNKTIVFITHDFDEAIRLANHIAIMQDGRIVQVGTAEQLVLEPASDYVREFTRHVPREKVISVRSVMVAGAHGAGEGIRASASIAEIAAQVIAADSPLSVIDAKGQAIGAIDREAVIAVLVGKGV